MSVVLDLILGRIQPQFDNDNDSLATTAFVQRALGNHQSATTITGNLVLTAADAGRVFIYAEPADITVTLPAFADAAAGSVFTVVNTGPNVVTVTRAGTDQIDAGFETVNSITVPRGQSARVLRATATLLWHSVTMPSLEFVQRSLGNLRSMETITGSMSLSALDVGKGYLWGMTGNATLTLPLLANIPAGSMFHFQNTNSGTLTIVTTSPDEIDTGDLSTATLVLPPYTSAKIIRSASSNLWHLEAQSIGARFSSLFAATLASPGNVRLPSGFILQWGRATVAATSSLSVTMATPTTENFGALVAVENATNTDDGVGAYSALNATSITLVNSNGGSRSLFYAVLGRIAT